MPQEPEEIAATNPDLDRIIYESSNPGGPVAHWLHERIKHPRQNYDGYHGYHNARTFEPPESPYEISSFEATKSTVEFVLTQQEAVKMPDLSKVGASYPASTEDNRPKCKNHGVRMDYNAAEDQMECPISDCKRIAKKARTFKGSFAPVENGTPVYRGEIEFVTDDDGVLYMYLLDTGVMISMAGVTDKILKGLMKPSNYAAGLVGVIDTLKAEAVEVSLEQQRKRKSQEALTEMTARQDKRRNTLLGITLPPHLQRDHPRIMLGKEVRKYLDTRSSMQAANDESISMGEIPTGITFRETRHYDIVATAIESLFPCRQPDGSVLLEFYDADGHYIRSTLSQGSKDVIHLSVAREILQRQSSNHIVEHPCYVMFNGRALTLADVAEQLKNKLSPPYKLSPPFPPQVSF